MTVTPTGRLRGLDLPQMQQMPLDLQPYQREALSKIKRTIAAALFSNDPIDCEWLRETHLKHMDPMPEFKSFELLGNEDYPDNVVLYDTVIPTVLDAPNCTLTRNQKGDLTACKNRVRNG